MAWKHLCTIVAHSHPRIHTHLPIGDSSTRCPCARGTHGRNLRARGSPKMYGSHWCGCPDGICAVSGQGSGDACLLHPAGTRTPHRPALDRVSGILVREMKAPRFWSTRPEPALWAAPRISRSATIEWRGALDATVIMRADVYGVNAFHWEGCGSSTRIGNKGKRARQIGHATSYFVLRSTPQGRSTQEGQDKYIVSYSRFNGNTETQRSTTRKSEGS